MRRSAALIRRACRFKNPMGDGGMRAQKKTLISKIHTVLSSVLGPSFARSDFPCAPRLAEFPFVCYTVSILASQADLSFACPPVTLRVQTVHPAHRTNRHREALFEQMIEPLRRPVWRRSLIPQVLWRVTLKVRKRCDYVEKRDVIGGSVECLRSHRQMLTQMPVHLFPHVH
jgi:hypothetical protein